MQPKFLIVGGVLVVAISGFFLWQLFGGGGSSGREETSPSESPVAAEAAPAEPLRGSASLTSLLARGENLECTVRQTVSATVSVEGTSFLSQGRIRGDFLTTDSGQTTLSSMIIADDTLYTWSEVEGEVYGVRLSLADTSTNTAAPAVDAREPVSPDDPVDYECRVWTAVDGSIFVPPSNVLFRDLTDVMNVGMEFGTVYESADSAAAQCALCDQLPDEETRRLCRQNIACE